MGDPWFVDHLIHITATTDKEFTEKIGDWAEEVPDFTFDCFCVKSISHTVATSNDWGVFYSAVVWVREYPSTELRMQLEEEAIRKRNEAYRAAHPEES